MRKDPGTEALEIVQDINNDLAVIHGYCEVAKMKRESGDELAQRMDDAIEAVDQLGLRIKRLVAVYRGARPD